LEGITLENKNLVKCKACGADIAKGVKKCPHCGKDQRNFFGRHKVLTGFGVIIILIIIISVASSGGSNSTTPASKTTDATQKSAAPAQKYQILSQGITTDSSGLRYVSGKIKNNSGKTATYVQVEINLYDSNGQQLGSTLANLNNLEAGQVWNFKAPITEDGTTKYKIIEVTGF
jgi:hypothetical protein